MACIRTFFTEKMVGILTCVLLGAVAQKAFCQQAADDFSDSVGSIITRTAPDANGERITDIKLSGTFGEVSFSMKEKEWDTIIKSGMDVDMGALTKLYISHSQENLGATPEEWKALAPRIHKVQRLRMVLRSQGQSSTLPGASTDFKKAWKALSAVIADKQAKGEDVKVALQAVNDAEAAVKKELEQAQKDLKELLTVRQEAIFVQNGIVD